MSDSSAQPPPSEGRELGARVAAEGPASGRPSGLGPAGPRGSRGGSSAPPRWGSLAELAGLSMLVGAVLPVSGGWLVPILGVVVATFVGMRRSDRISAGLQRVGGIEAMLRPLAPWQRGLLFALAVAPSAVLVTVVVRAIAGLLVAFPAAWWGLAMVLLGCALLALVGGRGRGPLAFVIVAAIAGAGVLGTAFEREGSDGRGWARSGPIHGIHPFQITAVMIDGYGPFDLPFNDYVEPDGARGYGPDAFAEALGLALRRIGELHFADGPARARRAFANAEVRPFATEAIQERLDREGPTGTQPRFEVVSGSHGQHSRVEFVCPGRRMDPRGPGGVVSESVMNRMCPDKYASEASAGLGVTGRWPGYTEARGNERVGLSRWLGWTRSDDAQGRSVVARELRWLAWLGSIALLGLSSWRRAGEGGRAIAGSTAIVAAIATAFAGVSAVGSAIAVPVVSMASFEFDPADASWWPLAVLALGIRPGTRASRAASLGGSTLGGWIALAVAGGTLAFAGNLGAANWVRPDLSATGATLPLQSWVIGISEAIGEPMGLTIFAVEGAIASLVLAVLLGLGLALLQPVGELGRHVLSAVPRGRRMVAWLLVLAIAAGLVVSRKTEGAAALMPGALGLMLIASSAWARLLAKGEAVRGASLAHLGWVAVGLVAIAASFRGLPLHPFALLCTAVGFAIASTSVVFVGVRPSTSHSTEPHNSDDGA